MKLTVSQKKLLKRTAIVLGVFCLLFVLALRFLLDPFLEKKLIQAASAGSDGMYTLEIKHLHCNPFSGYAYIEQMWLHTDTVLLNKRRLEKPGIPISDIDLHVAQIEIQGARFIHSFISKNIDLGQVVVKDPDIRVNSFRDSTRNREYASDSIEKSLLERLPALLSPHAHSIRATRFSFINAKLYLETQAIGKHNVQQADSIQCTLDDIYIPEVAQDTAQRALYADDVRGDFKNYYFTTNRSPYALAIGAGTFRSKDEMLKMTSVSTGPLINDVEFIARQKFRRARIRLNLNALQISHLNFFQALHQNRWIMQTLEIERGDMDVYVNKTVENVPDKQMPNEILRALDFYLKADSVLVKNIDIVYKEVKPDGEGSITFLNTEVKIINLSNDSLVMSDTSPAYIYAQTRLMGRGLLNLTVAFPLLSRNFNCAFRATLDSMPLDALNPIFQKDGLLFEDGHLAGIQMQANVVNGKSTGTLDASYRNLKVNVKSADGKRIRAFLTPLVNMLLRNKNKPWKEPLHSETGTIDYQRIPGDDFLRFLWRSARSGLQQILLPNGINVPLPKDHPVL